MDYSMKQETQNSLDRLFDRLFTAKSVEPYGLPIFKQFPAPVDTNKFDAFFATYKANGWHLEEALAPYKDDKQVAMCVFYDPTTNEYKFCPWLEVLWQNGYHVSMVEQE